MENGYIGTTLSVCDEVVAMYKKNKGKNPWTYFFRDDGLSLEKRYENWAPLRYTELRVLHPECIHMAPIFFIEDKVQKAYPEDYLVFQLLGRAQMVLEFNQTRDRIISLFEKGGALKLLDNHGFKKEEFKIWLSERYKFFLFEIPEFADSPENLNNVISTYYPKDYQAFEMLFQTHDLNLWGVVSAD